MLNLNDRLQLTKDGIKAEQWHKFNLGTVENFIYHLNQIQNSNIKVDIELSLLEYLDFVDTINSMALRKPESIKLYQEFLEKIEVHYSRIGFVTYFHLFTYVYLFAFICPLILVFKLSFLYLMVVIILMIIHKFWLRNKEKRKMVFSPWY
jgi:hypothetical protein